MVLITTKTDVILGRSDGQSGTKMNKKRTQTSSFYVKNQAEKNENLLYKGCQDCS